jgi:hypothetical protein
MASRFCKHCEKHVRAVPRYQVNHVAQILFSMFTLGLWLPMWFFACVLSVMQGNECPHCGGKL